jgi:hypothetical protein
MNKNSSKFALKIKQLTVLSIQTVGTYRLSLSKRGGTKQKADFNWIFRALKLFYCLQVRLDRLALIQFVPLPLNLHNFLLFVFDAKASFLKRFLVF